MHEQKILVVDDDRDLVNLLARSFSKEGAEVLTAANGQEGLRLFHQYQPDLVILAIVMPVLNGWQTSARIRQFSNAPVILLSVKGTEDDVVRGLACGAVDYVAKPFSVQVLLARARAALREAAAGFGPGANGYYDDGRLSIDAGRRRVMVRGAPVDLTATEYSLLLELFRNAGRVLTYDQILGAVWGRAYRDSPQYVHVYVYRLRQKLEEDPGQPMYLQTEHGTGYRFAKQPPGS